MIADGLDVASLLQPSWGTGDIAPSGAPDVVGAFRFICAAGQLSYDDPIVYPGQPGASHLHQFFGNTLTNAHSTYRSLRTTGDSTCNNALNRSAYWIPAMLDGVGGVVRPDYLAVYYKRRPASDPYCSTAVRACVPLPRGLRMVWGANHATGQPGNGYFNCGRASGEVLASGTMDVAAAACPLGAQLVAVIGAPDCWNGTQLDSADHRSHVAFGFWNGNTGNYECPTTHPYMIPTFTLQAAYEVDANLATWRLSSDHDDHPRGSTLHADWFGAWNDAVLATWENNCINRLLSCTGMDLGNGTQPKMTNGYTLRAEPRVVPASAI